MEAPAAAAVGGSSSSTSSAARVRVAVRCRPLNDSEQSAGGASAVTISEGSRLALKHKNDSVPFVFDHAFGPETEQRQIFEALGASQLDQAFEGYNSTIFAYGQTGSGKTHTMMNARAQALDDRGLIPRISDGLFERIAELSRQSISRRFLVQCSLMEIYNENVYDLLAPKRRGERSTGLEVKEQKGIGVFVKDLTETVVESAEKLGKLIEEGMAMRAVAATRMNDASSRSHCIFTIRLHQKDKDDSSQNTISLLNLVDLAGSERSKDTGAEGALLKEGANINKSLSALGHVINALSSMAETGKKRAYVPYRDSKLTRVLQESLGGNAFCTMVASISPSATNVEETLSTLNFAKRAKVIRVAAKRNAETAQLKQLELEMEALHQKLHMDDSQQARDVEGRHRQELEHLETVMKQSWEDKQKLSEEHEVKRKNAKEEMALVAERMRGERRRKLQMLEHRGDLHLTLQAVEAAAGERASAAEWPGKIVAALKAWEQVQSQLRAVALYRESAGADLAALWGRAGQDVGFDDGEVAPALTLLGQVRSKLETTSKELGQLLGLEAQVQEQLGQLAPEVAVALGTARAEAEAAAAAAAEASAGGGEEAAAASAGEEAELPELIELVQSQLAAHCAREGARAESDVRRLLFGTDLDRLTQCLSREAASGGRESGELLEELRRAAEDTSAVWQAPAVAPDDAAASARPPRLLGMATGELPGERLRASSNAGAASSARLLHSGCYGGWCPNRDSPEEYLELELGPSATVVGIGLQGREPCSGSWAQTNELLRLAVAGHEEECGFLGVPGKTFARPPVRLVHEVALSLVESGQCFGSGQHCWEVEDDYVIYASMSREHKVAFFDQLIKRANQAWERQSNGAGGVAAKITADSILSGKKCEETNRLLQMLSYLCLQEKEAAEAAAANNSNKKVAAAAAIGGLGDAAPQWVTKWRLEFFSEAAGAWRFYAPGGAPEGAADTGGALLLEGCADTSTVRYVALPRPITASRIRLHPAEWHRRPALRCEVHLSAQGGAEAGGSAASASLSSRHLVSGLELAGRAAEALKELLDERLRVQSRREVDLKEQAEQERGELERRLQEALARAEASEARAAAAEADLLRARADNERIGAAAKLSETELHAAAEAKAGAEAKAVEREKVWRELQVKVADLTDELLVMTDERDALRSHEEELVNAVAAKDEELARAHKKYVDLTKRMEDKADAEAEDDLLAEEMGRMSEQLNQIQGAHEDSLRECAWLREEVTTLKASNEALMHERDKLARKKDKLEAKKADLVSKLEVSEKMRLAALDRAKTMLEKREGEGSHGLLDDIASVGRSSRPLSAHSSRSGRSAHGTGAAAAIALGAGAGAASASALAGGGEAGVGIGSFGAGPGLHSSPRFGGNGNLSIPEESTHEVAEQRSPAFGAGPPSRAEGMGLRRSHKDLSRDASAPELRSKSKRDRKAAAAAAAAAVATADCQ